MRNLTAIILASLFVASIPTGCNYIVPISYAIDGSGKTPAEHELVQEKTLVFIDDHTNVLPRTMLRANLAEEISSVLVREELVPVTVAPTDAMALVRSRERNGNRMSMESIAKESGVSQMIFIEMETFSLTKTDWNPRPNASCLVRVLDFNNGVRVYPKGDLGEYGGRRVSVTMRELSPDVMRSAAARRKAQMNLVTTLSGAVLKLFYEHETKDLGENLGVR